jgi:hypothetical protein
MLEGADEVWIWAGVTRVPLELEVDEDDDELDDGDDELADTDEEEERLGEDVAVEVNAEDDEALVLADPFVASPEPSPGPASRVALFEDDPLPAASRDLDALPWVSASPAPPSPLRSVSVPRSALHPTSVATSATLPIPRTALRTIAPHGKDTPAALLRHGRNPSTGSTRTTRRSIGSFTPAWRRSSRP